MWIHPQVVASNRKACGSDSSSERFARVRGPEFPAERSPDGVGGARCASAAAESVVARLDHLVDDRQPLGERQERGLHRVHREPLQLVPAVAESLARARSSRWSSSSRDISRLSVLTVTRNFSAASSPIGCSAIDVDRPGLHVGRRRHLQRDPLVPDVGGQPAQLAVPSRATVMSSTIRTPWPSRSAPHHCSASQIDGRPNASPAWMVKCAFSRRRYSNASRCRVGGNPASAPAMSNPATPSSRKAMPARRSPGTGRRAASR